MAQEYDLSALFELAKAKDPTLGRAFAQTEAGKAEHAIARSALLPHLNAGGSLKRFWHSVLDYTPTTQTGQYTGYSYNAAVDVPVFSMPSYYDLSAAKAGCDSAESQLAATRQELMVRLSNAYITLLKAQSDIHLYRDQTKRLAIVLKQAQAFLKAGTGDIIAVYEAQAQQDSANADLVKAESQLRLAEQQLSRLAGTTVTSIRDITPSTPSKAQPDDLEWWLATLSQRHPALNQAQHTVRQYSLYRSAARARHLPTVQASGGYTVDKGSTFLPDVETRQWYVGLALNIPLFSGGETSARSKLAIAQETDRRLVLDDTREQLTQRLKEAFLSIQYNIKLSEAYQHKVTSTDIQLKAVTRGRAIGTRSLGDLLQAEHASAVSRRDLQHALYDNIQLHIELKAAAGILAIHDFVEINQHLPIAAAPEPQ